MIEVYRTTTISFDDPKSVMNIRNDLVKQGLNPVVSFSNSKMVLSYDERMFFDVDEGGENALHSIIRENT